MGRSIRITVADDHAVVRSALSLLLAEEDGFEVVDESGDIESTLRSVHDHQPDVLVLDLNMPDGRSLGAIPEILEASPLTAVVVLTMETDPAYAREAMRSGVLGYVLKEAADAELVSAVRTAAAGNTYLQPELGARLASDDRLEPDGLSERELEILRLIAFGHTNSEMAEQLFLSVRTVESHRARIQRKLKLRKRSELVRYALSRGLLETDV
jgi:two-component system response regulator NreC